MNEHNNQQMNENSNENRNEITIVHADNSSKEDIIMNCFFKEYTYYYNHTTGIFFKYKNDNFIIISENELTYNILSYISLYRDILNINTISKIRIKNKILKIIKTKTIYDNIPNSSCLQRIIGFFYPNFLNDSDYVKYLLITIGDIIMKKTKQIYYVPLYLKQFLINLNKYISLLFTSVNIFNFIKFKHIKNINLSVVRIFKMNNININYFMINSQLFIDIICVSIHYSSRYISGELFLKDNVSVFKSDVLVESYTKKNIIHTFFNEYIIITDDSCINKKDMIFIWKYFISNHNYIDFFTNNEVMILLSSYIKVRNNNFINVTSKYLPHVVNFKKFWTNYIEYDNDDEYEISELLMLFHTIYNDKINIDEFKKLILYYYPDIYILKNKHVLNIKCTIWNKKKDLSRYIIKDNTDNNINDLYMDYCKNYTNYKVSKNYFIKYIK